MSDPATARPEPLDLRLAPVAAAAWAAAAWGSGVPLGRALAASGALVVGAVVLWRQAGASRATWPRRAGDGWRTVAGLVLVVAAAALATGSIRSAVAASGPVSSLAEDRAEVDVHLEIDSDPRLRAGSYGPYVLVHATVRRVEGRGRTSAVRSPVLVIADPVWRATPLGARVSAEGRLQVADGNDLAAVLVARGPPVSLEGPSAVERGIARLRAGIVETASGLGPAERALIPALVDGDDSALPEQTVADFQVTGLTHLLAVSGTNLTLVLWCVLAAARACGARSYGLVAVGIAATVLFVLLARGEPSVLRAAAMGAVGLAGLTAGGRRRGVRALFLSVIVLVLVDPNLARSVGFALSVLATAGILVLAPAWRDALATWLPRGAAEAVAVPLAAQVVCTPVIAAISGQVSLVAVVANLVAAPAVGPATVLGLAGGIVALLHDGASHLVGWCAGLPAAWLVQVADHGAALPGAAVEGAVGPGPLSLVVLGSAVALVILPRVLRMRWLCLVHGVVLTMAIWQPVQVGGWPPDDWALAVCDVGQGDALVLHAGRGAGVVVDAGPDPAAVDRCLDRLGVTSVPLVVLTHFHADHVDGLPGVLAGRRVGEIQVSGLPEPAAQATDVRAWAARARVPLTVAVRGEVRRVGAVRWRVIGPVESPVSTDTGEGEGSAPNNASTMMVADVAGIRVLLTGDAEPEEETDVLDSGVPLDVDVLKLAHHGSSNQDWDFVRASAPEVAVVSAGSDNTYGHPAAETLAVMRRIGAPVFRTDRDGTIAISPGPWGGVRVTTR